MAAKLAGVQSKSGALEQSQLRQSVAVSRFLSVLIRAEYDLSEGVSTVVAATVASAASGSGLTWRLAGWSADEATECLARLSRALIEAGVAFS